VGRVTERLRKAIDTHWRALAVAGWLAIAAYLLWQRWSAIHWFALGDTDDNLRLAQVRSWLGGQDWFDLRQHRLDPAHGGANIHWSRIVDLPIAGLILSLRPLLGPIGAEKWASAIAPLIPLLPMIVGLSLVIRRLVSPLAMPLGIVALALAGSTMGMVMPLRIDHHGWQLALLIVSLAGLADPDRRRGGLTTGLSSAISLAIGLEMIIYIALMGAAQVLFWVTERDERDRLLTYAVSFAGGCAFGFLAFASYANRAPVCDALSPVWLSDALVGGALMAGLAFVRVEKWTTRLALAAAAGVIVAAFHALAWPHCLSRLEGVSPEADALWLSHVKEARPIWTHGAEVALLVVGLPFAGLAGYALMAWRARRSPNLLRRVLAVAAPAFVALALLAWQTRTGPAAQLLAIPSAVSLAYFLVPPMQRSGNSLVRVLGTVAVVLAGMGAAVPLLTGFFPKPATTAFQKRIARANARCPTLPALRPIALQPKGIVFTFVDFGPRIISMTHHDAITGPYHRNYRAIVDVMKAFRGDAGQAHRVIVDEYKSNYVLVCPDQSSATIFMSEAPGGFYTQLVGGKVPGWLAPVDLGANSPWRMWRVVG
jgi:hypothetical protein